MKQRGNLDRIAAAGASAFYTGKLYSENPHLPGSAARLAWGEGHNGARRPSSSRCRTSLDGCHPKTGRRLINFCLKDPQ
jgi:hypothetical protein